jgi:hypothetical protein
VAVAENVRRQRRVASDGIYREETGRAEVVVPAGRLRLALYVGAAIWAFLLLVGFFAPGGWVWGMAGPIGHIENYMISLWAVSLVLAPLLASRDPLGRRGIVQVYLLGVLAIVLSTFRGEALKWISDAPPLVAATIAIGLVVWLHPDRSALWRW